MPQAYSGICHLCKQTFNKSGMTRHLKACQKNLASPLTGKSQQTFWLAVSGHRYPAYWMHLDVPASFALRDLDQFLRDIWLECCGHLSAFTIGNTRYELDTGMVDAMWKDFFGPSRPVRKMSVSLSSVLQPGLIFDHEYDFGTTTELKIKVVAQQQRVGTKREILILARNHPPEIPCGECGKPAKIICGYCSYQPEGWLCEKCAKKHKCGDEAFLPVVNSPRTGECGYTGNGRE